MLLRALTFYKLNIGIYVCLERKVQRLLDAKQTQRQDERVASGTQQFFTVLTVFFRSFCQNVDL